MDQEEVLKVLKQIDKKLSNCECKCVCKKFKMKKPKKSQNSQKTKKRRRPVQRSFAEQIAYEKDMRKQVGALVLAEQLSAETIKNLSENKIREYLSGKTVRISGARGRYFTVSILDDSMRRDAERRYLESIRNIALKRKEEMEISSLFSQMNIPGNQTLEERIESLKLQ